MESSSLCSDRWTRDSPGTWARAPGKTNTQYNSIAPYAARGAHFTLPLPLFQRAYHVHRRGIARDICRPVTVVRTLWRGNSPVACLAVYRRWRASGKQSGAGILNLLWVFGEAVNGEGVAVRRTLNVRTAQTPAWHASALLGVSYLSREARLYVCSGCNHAFRVDGYAGSLLLTLISGDPADSWWLPYLLGVTLCARLLSTPAVPTLYGRRTLTATALKRHVSLSPSRYLSILSRRYPRAPRTWYWLRRVKQRWL